MNLFLGLRPIAVRCLWPFFTDTPRRNGDRQGDDQEPRQMMRPDIDGIEMERERQHHHRVLGAGRKRNHDIGDRKRK